MKIALLGYGRMGKAIEKFALDRGHQITFIQDKDTHSGEIKGADIAINFSIPEAAVDNIKLAFDHDVPVVCGTTGWLNQYEEIVAYCQKKQSGFLYASNFSIGVNLFFKINSYVAGLMKAHQKDYTPSIEEIHHIHKIDAPSGTALTLAEGVLKESNLTGWQLEGTATDKLSIKSVREGEVPGTHRIAYRSEIDEISIKHQAFGREGFALGAVIAAEWLAGKKGVFSMDDVLNFHST